jgi:hypothetical protein
MRVSPLSSGTLGLYRSPASRLAGGIFVGLLCLLGIALKWLKLNSLVSMDPGWWMNQAGRMASGEMPYRDYFWPYGPLSIAVLAYPMRWFGLRFVVVQVTVDLLSIAVVVLIYVLAKRVLPAPLPEACCILLVCIGITVATYFSLFSLISYTPSVHVAGIGLLLLMLGCVRHVQAGRIERKNLVLMVVGSWIACLGKQEPLLASVVAMAALAWLDRSLVFASNRSAWLRHYGWLGLACFAPPAVVYGAVIFAAGWTKFSGNMRDFGVSSISCAWWPTGYGLLGAVAALGAALLAVACGSLVRPGIWLRRFRAGAPLLWIAAPVAAAFFMAFEWDIFSGLLFGEGSALHRLNQYGPRLFSSSSFLRPVLWSSIALELWIVWQWASGRKRTEGAAVDLLLILVPVVMSTRSLFGSTLAPTLEVPAISYPFLIFLVPYLFFRAMRMPDAGASVSPIPAWTCVALMVLYSVVRITGGYSQLWGLFPEVHTRAGTVRLAEAPTEAALYDYVVRNTPPGGAILEVPFGGGLAFAAHLRTPTYSNAFAYLEPPEEIQEEDRRRVEADPPSFVIGNSNDPRLSTLYGTRGTLGCSFPAILWLPNRPSSQPDYVFPFYRVLEEKYRVDRDFGNWRVLRPAS